MGAVDDAERRTGQDCWDGEINYLGGMDFGDSEYVSVPKPPTPPRC
jgi:hypothetical protein